MSIREGKESWRKDKRPSLGAHYLTGTILSWLDNKQSVEASRWVYGVHESTSSGVKVLVVVRVAAEWQQDRNSPDLSPSGNVLIPAGTVFAKMREVGSNLERTRESDLGKIGSILERSNGNSMVTIWVNDEIVDYFPFKREHNQKGVECFDVDTGTFVTRNPQLYFPEGESCLRLVFSQIDEEAGEAGPRHIEIAYLSRTRGPYEPSLALAHVRDPLTGMLRKPPGPKHNPGLVLLNRAGFPKGLWTTAQDAQTSREVSIDGAEITYELARKRVWKCYEKQRSLKGIEDFHTDVTTALGSLYTGMGLGIDLKSDISTKSQEEVLAHLGSNANLADLVAAVATIEFVLNALAKNDKAPRSTELEQQQAEWGQLLGYALTIVCRASRVASDVDEKKLQRWILEHIRAYLNAHMATTARQPLTTNLGVRRATKHLWIPESKPHHPHMKRLMNLVKSAPWVRWFIQPAWPITVSLPIDALGDALHTMPPNEVLTPNQFGHWVQRTPLDLRKVLDNWGLTVVRPDGREVEETDLDAFQEIWGFISRNEFQRATTALNTIENQLVRDSVAPLIESMIVADGSPENLWIVVDSRSKMPARILLVNRSDTTSLPLQDSLSDEAYSLDPYQAPSALSTGANGSLTYRQSTRVVQALDLTTRLTVTATGTGEERTFDFSKIEQSKQLPNSDGRQLDPRLFVGRDGLIAEIQEVAFCGTNSRPIFIQGNRRAGKTTLAKMCLMDKFGQAGYESLDVSSAITGRRDLAGCIDVEVAASDLVKSLYDAINNVLKRREEDVLPNEMLGEASPSKFLEIASHRIGKQGCYIGLLLDEFDSLLYVPELAHIVSNLGNSGNWPHIATIATVQRHAHELKEWKTLACPSLLTVPDAVKYWSPSLLPENECEMLPADQIHLDQSALFEEVLPRVSTRAVFWGDIYQKLSAKTRNDGYRIATRNEVKDAIDDVLKSANHLVLMTQSLQDLQNQSTTAERDRLTKDSFDLNELGVLFFMSDKNLVNTSNWKPQYVAAIDSLSKREIVRHIGGDRYGFHGSIWAEYINSHRAAFTSVCDEPLVDPDGRERVKPSSL